MKKTTPDHWKYFNSEPSDPTMIKKEPEKIVTGIGALFDEIDGIAPAPQPIPAGSADFKAPKYDAWDVNIQKIVKDVKNFGFVEDGTGRTTTTPEQQRGLALSMMYNLVPSLEADRVSFEDACRIVFGPDEVEGMQPYHVYKFFKQVTDLYENSDPSKLREFKKKSPKDQEMEMFLKVPEAQDWHYVAALWGMGGPRRNEKFDWVDGKKNYMAQLAAKDTWTQFLSFTKHKPEIRRLAMGMAMADGNRTAIAEFYDEKLLELSEADKNNLYWAVRLLNPKMKDTAAGRILMRVGEGLTDNKTNIAASWEVNAYEVNQHTVFDMVKKADAIDENGKFKPGKLKDIQSELKEFQKKHDPMAWTPGLKHSSFFKEYSEEEILSLYNEGKQYNARMKQFREIRELMRSNYDKSDSRVPDVIENAFVVGIDMLKYVGVTAAGTALTKSPMAGASMASAMMYTEFSSELFNELHYDGNVDAETARGLADFSALWMTGLEYFQVSRFAKTLRPNSYLLGADITKATAKEYYQHTLKEMLKTYAREGTSETLTEYGQTLIEYSTKAWAADHADATFDKKQLWEDTKDELWETTKVMPLVMLGSTSIGGGRALKTTWQHTGAPKNPVRIANPSDMMNHNVRVLGGLVQAQASDSVIEGKYGEVFADKYYSAKTDAERQSLLDEYFKTPEKRKEAEEVLKNHESIKEGSDTAFNELIITVIKREQEDAQRINAEADKNKGLFEVSNDESKRPVWTAVNTFLEKFGGREDVVFVRSVADMPPSLQSEAEKFFNETKRKGFFDPDTNKYYLIESHIKDGIEALATLAHERSHWVLQRLRASKQYDAIINEVLSLMGGDAAIRATGILPPEYDTNSKEEIAEEFIARIAEKVAIEAVLEESQNQVWLKVKKWTKEQFGTKTIADFTEKRLAEIVKTVLRASNDMAAGKIPAVSSQWEAATQKSLGNNVKGKFVITDASRLKPYHSDNENKNSFGSNISPAEISANLDALELDASTSSDTGAPIVTPEGYILSGNKRIQAIKDAISQQSPQAAKYLEHIHSRAREMALEIPQSLTMPVLVRQVEDMGGLTPDEFIKQSNERTQEATKEIAAARADAEALNKSGFMSQYEAPQSNDLLSQSYIGFVMNFIDAIGGRKAYIDKNGNVKPTLAPRMRRAILTYYLDNPNGNNLSKLLIPNKRFGHLVDSLQWAALKLVEFKKNAEFDISEEINEAARLHIFLNNQGTNLKRFLEQRTETEPPLNETVGLLVELFEANTKSPRGIFKVLNGYYGLVSALPKQTGEIDVHSLTPNPAKIDLLRQAVQDHTINNTGNVRHKIDEEFDLNPEEQSERFTEDEASAYLKQYPSKLPYGSEGGGFAARGLDGRGFAEVEGIGRSHDGRSGNVRDEAQPERRPGQAAQNDARERILNAAIATYTPNEKFAERLKALNKPALPVVEINDAELFFELISKAKEQNPSAASVSLYTAQEYANMRLFVTENGEGGAAINEDNAISLFKMPDAPSGVAYSILPVVIGEGGQRLDCFDIYLPRLYSMFGFEAVARTSFVDEFSPDGWDYKEFETWNNGRPDVVFMTYTGKGLEGGTIHPKLVGENIGNFQRYDAQHGQKAEDYDAGEQIQKAARVKWNIIGEKGAKRYKNGATRALTIAKKMRAKGYNPVEIWQATGWDFKELDQKWRYELPYGKLKTTDLEAFTKYKLGDIFDAPDLYKAWPSARNINVSFSDIPGTAYLERNNIVLDNTLTKRYAGLRISFPENVSPEERKKIVNDFIDKILPEIFIHEVQHWVQDHEGFARGGASREYSSIAEYVKNYLNEINIELKRRESGQFSGETPIIELLKTRESGNNFLNKYPDARTFYLALGGEVESRNVEFRGTGEDVRTRFLFPPSYTEDTQADRQIVMGDRYPIRWYGDIEESPLKIRNLIRQDRLENPVVWASIVLAKDVLIGNGITPENLEKALPLDMFDGTQRKVAADRALMIAEITRAKYRDFAKDLDRKVKLAENSLYWSDEVIKNLHATFSKGGEQYAFSFQRLKEYREKTQARLVKQAEGVKTEDFSIDFVQAILNAKEHKPTLSEDKEAAKENEDKKKDDEKPGADNPAKEETPKQPQELLPPTEVIEIISKVRADVEKRTDAELRNSLVTREVYKKSLINLLTDSMNELVITRERENILKKIHELKSANFGYVDVESGPHKGQRVDNFTMRAEHIAARIHNRSVRDNRKALFEKFQSITRYVKPPKRIMREDDRRMAGAVELRLSRIVDMARWDIENVDSEIQKTINAVNDPSSDSGTEFADKLINAVEYLNDLKTFGALQDKSLAEMTEANEWISSYMKGEIEEHAQKVAELKEKAAAKRKIIIDAINAIEGNAKTHSPLRKMLRQLFNTALTFRHIFEGLGRAAKTERHEKFKQLSDDFVNAIYAATTQKENEVFRHQGELTAAVEEIYQTTAHEAFKHLLEARPDYDRFSNPLQQEVMSVQKLLQRLAEAEQKGYVNNVYYNNIIPGPDTIAKQKKIDALYDDRAKSRRFSKEYFELTAQIKAEEKEFFIEKEALAEKYAQSIRGVLVPQDIEFLNWLRAFYNRERESLSGASEIITGLGIPNPDPLFMPMKMKRSGGTGESVRMVPIIPKSLTPRVPNTLDIDEGIGVLDIWQDRIEENAQYKAFAELHIEWRGVFAHEDFHRAVENKLGGDVLSHLIGHFNDIMSAKLPNDLSFTALDKFNSFYAISALGFNLGSGVRQVTAFPAFANYIGLKNVFKYAADCMSPEGMAAMKEIFQSETALRRMSRGNQQILVESLSSLDGPAWWKWYKRHALVFNKYGDILPILTIGQGIYRAGVERYKAQNYSEADAKKRAMTEMWELSEITQQSPSVVNMSLWQRRWGSLGKAFGLFTSSPQLFLSKEIADITRAMSTRDPKDIKKAAQTVAINHFGLQGFYAIATLMWKALLGDDWDDDDWEWVFWETLAGPFGGLIVFGRFLAAFSSDFGGIDIAPIEGAARIIKPTIDLLPHIIKGDIEGALKDFDKIGKSTLAPYREIRKVIKNASDNKDGALW